MAEFQEVIKNARRLCRTREFCNGCPLSLADEVCYFDSICDPHIDIDFGKMEFIVTEWAKEHPEPQYPTWEEWQKENFPDADMVVNLCNFVECDKPCFESECRKWPIPADIAERLGIAPLKGAKSK